MLTFGLLLSPSIVFLLLRMAQGFGGVNLNGFGSMEVLLLPLYLIPALLSVIFIGLGLERIHKQNHGKKKTSRGIGLWAELLLATLVGVFIIADVLYIASIINDAGLVFGVMASFFPLIFLVLALILFVMCILSIKKYRIARTK